jgi:NADH:ubiquinone oxidoreductase subunit 2 (subunit N)
VRLRLLLLLRGTELLTIFLALELLSSASTPRGFHRRAGGSAEAAIKYFLMGAFVSAFVLYGIALVYGETGSHPARRASACGWRAARRRRRWSCSASAAAHCGSPSR